MNITLPRAVIEQTLEALEKKHGHWGKGHDDLNASAATALRAALEQPERKPLTQDLQAPLTLNGVALYPRQQPLSDEQLKPLIQKAMMYYGHNPDHWLQTSGAGFCILSRAIEAAHGIKGDA